MMDKPTVRFSFHLPGMTDGPRSRPAGAAAVRLHGDVPHHFPELHDRAVRVHRHAAGALDAHRARASAPAGAVLDQDLRGLLRHGRGVGDRAQLPVRHQLEPVLGGRRQRGRPAHRLRGADRLLPRSDVPRRDAVRLAAGAAVAARDVGDLRRRRHRHLGVLDPGGEFVDADAGGLRAARRRRLSARLARDHLQSELSLSLRPHAHRHLPDDLAGGAGGRRPLPAGRAPSRGEPDHDAHGDRHAGPARSIAAPDRRPARAQHARAPADQDRGDGGALGRQQARRAGAVRLAGREGRDEPFRDRDPEGRIAHPQARSQRPVPRAQERAAGRPAAAASRSSSPSGSWWASAS